MKVYKKVGKRYKEIGQEFTGFPADGLWLVKDGSQSLIQKLADYGDIPPLEIAKFFKHRDQVCKDLIEYIDDVAKKTRKETPHGVWTTYPSINDLVTCVFLSLAKREN